MGEGYEEQGRRIDRGLQRKMEGCLQGKTGRLGAETESESTVDKIFHSHEGKGLKSLERGEGASLVKGGLSMGKGNIRKTAEYCARKERVYKA